MTTFTKAAEESDNLKKRPEAVEQMLKKMFVYEYDIDIDLKNHNVLERETLEGILRRVDISNRRLE